MEKVTIAQSERQLGCTDQPASAPQSEDGMDISTAPQGHPEPNYKVSATPGASIAPANGSRYPSYTASPAGSPAQTTPLRHGLIMGAATTVSVVISCCCLLSVANYLGPNYRILNTLMFVTSILAGIFVGFRSWQNRRAPRPVSNGQCPDCGRELTVGQQSCSLCGRVVQ